MNIKFSLTKEIVEEYSINRIYDIDADGETVGTVCVISDDDYAYIERIDIEESNRNRGIGTQVIKELSYEYGRVVLAPDNEDAKRLYERIGREFTEESAYYLDQGFGVYEV